MYRELYERIYERFRQLARRVAVALRIIPPVKLTIIGARGGLIHANIEGIRLTVRDGEERTITLPRNTLVNIYAEPLKGYRFVAILVDNIRIGEQRYSFRIIYDTRVTAIFEYKCWRVQSIWQIVSRRPTTRSPIVSAELRIYSYTVADSEEEAEEKLEDIEELYEEIQDPSKVDPPESAVTSFASAEKYGRAWIEREPPYGVEVVEVDCDEVEEFDVPYAYLAVYRQDRPVKSYKWRREGRVWRFIGRGE